MITFQDLQQKIRELAYIKWEQSGKLGNSEQYWVEAEKELFGNNPLKNGGYYIKKNNKLILITPNFPFCEKSHCEK